MVEEGIRDLVAGVETVAACLVSIGAPKLRALGCAIPTATLPSAEHRLYALLAKEGSDTAHARYNALLRRLVSFEHAAACVR